MTKRGGGARKWKRLLQEDFMVEQEQTTTEYQYLSFRERERIENSYMRAKNPAQEKYIRYLKNPAKKIVIATGPAGTGKTLFATEFGVRKFLAGEIDYLIFTRPVVQVDEDIGYLPGTLEEKMNPYVRPIFDVLCRHMSMDEIRNHMNNTKKIEIAPLAFMRGRTFRNAWIIADEMQNATVSQMKMLLTRLGEGSRLVVTGDLDQFDRRDGLAAAEANGLADFLDKLERKRTNSISSVEFETKDIEREEVVRDVLEIYGAAEIPCHSPPNTPNTEEGGTLRPL